MRPRYRLASAALFFFLTLSSHSGSPAGAKQHSTGIAGRVTTLDGALVPDATIQASKGEIKLTATTNAKGEYWLELEPGIYDISIGWPWKPAKRKNIKVEKNTKSTVDFVLQRKPIATR
jgi:hypothetical protein